MKPDTILKFYRLIADMQIICIGIKDKNTRAKAICRVDELLLFAREFTDAYGELLANEKFCHKLVNSLISAERKLDFINLTIEQSPHLKEIKEQLKNYDDRIIKKYQ